MRKFWPLLHRFWLLQVVFVLFPACSDVPSNPTWDDVEPILLANCARCHTDPPILGALTNFRLDVYDDSIGQEGQTLVGASTMAERIVVRIADDTDPMPPAPARRLTERQREILTTWWANGSPL